MNIKTTMVLIALMGVGLFALPQTTALFAGQHSFTNIDATGNQIECTKCHGDVQAELGSGGVSTVTGTEGPHANFKCEYCHRIEAGSSSGDNAYGVIPYAVKVGTTTYRRIYLVPVSDMEAGNVPLSINGSDVVINNGTTSSPKWVRLAGVDLKFGNGKLSAPVTVPGDLPLTTADGGDKSGWKLASTYNATTGKPYDTTATADAGLDLNNVVITMITARPYYTANFDGAGSRTVNPGTSYHAASIVSCIECHAGDEPMGHYSRVADGTDVVNGTVGAVACSNCHYSDLSHVNQIYTIWAGGFGLTGGQDTGATEAHMTFATTPDDNGVAGQNITRQKDGMSNGACVACHTHVAVDITYTKPTTYTFDANLATGVDSGFSVGSTTKNTYSDGRTIP